MKTTTRGKSRTGSKPCCICAKRFTPSPRLGERQKTCGRPGCKAERKRRVQAQWASDNADYWTERRLREQAERLVSGDSKPSGKPPPPGLEMLPVSYVLDEMGAHAAVILPFLARLQHRIAQVAIRKQIVDVKRELSGHAHRTPQVSLPIEQAEIAGELNGHPRDGAQVAIGDSGGRA